MNFFMHHLILFFGIPIAGAAYLHVRRALTSDQGTETSNDWLLYLEVGALVVAATLASLLIP